MYRRDSECAQIKTSAPSSAVNNTMADERDVAMIGRQDSFSENSTCVICQETKLRGLYCDATDGDERQDVTADRGEDTRHFTCLDCFPPYVISQCDNVMQLKLREFRICCCVNDCLVPYKAHRVLKALTIVEDRKEGERAIEMYLKKLRELATTEVEEDNPLLRLTSNSSAIFHLVAEALNPKCPFRKCGTYLDPSPDGCMAMDCKKCGGFFCFLCFETFQDSLETHNHVKQCSLNPATGQEYFVKENDYRRIHKSHQIKSIQAALDAYCSAWRGDEAIADALKETAMGLLTPVGIQPNDIYASQLQEEALQDALSRIEELKEAIDNNEETRLWKSLYVRKDQDPFGFSAKMAKLPEQIDFAMGGHLFDFMACIAGIWCENLYHCFVVYSLSSVFFILSLSEEAQEANLQEEKDYTEYVTIFRVIFSPGCMLMGFIFQKLRNIDVIPLCREISSCLRENMPSDEAVNKITEKFVHYEDFVEFMDNLSALYCAYLKTYVSAIILLYVLYRLNLCSKSLLYRSFSICILLSSLGSRGLLDFVSFTKLVNSMSSTLFFDFSGVARAFQFPGVHLLLQLCCVHLVDVIAIAQKLDRDGIVNVFIIKIFLDFCRNFYHEAKLLSVEILPQWIACGFALLCTFFAYRVSNVMRSAISTRILKSDNKVKSSKVLHDWLFVLLFCADGDICLLDSWMKIICAFILERLTCFFIIPQRLKEIYEAFCMKPIRAALFCAQCVLLCFILNFLLIDTPTDRSYTLMLSALAGALAICVHQFGHIENVAQEPKHWLAGDLLLSFLILTLYLNQQYSRISGSALNVVYKGYCTITFLTIFVQNHSSLSQFIYIVSSCICTGVCLSARIHEIDVIISLSCYVLQQFYLSYIGILLKREEPVIHWKWYNSLLSFPFYFFILAIYFLLPSLLLASTSSI